MADDMEGRTITYELAEQIVRETLQTMLERPHDMGAERWEMMMIMESVISRTLEWLYPPEQWSEVLSHIAATVLHDLTTEAEETN